MYMNTPRTAWPCLNIYLSLLAGARTFFGRLAVGGSNRTAGATRSAVASVRSASKVGLLSPASIREM